MTFSLRAAHGLALTSKAVYSDDVEKYSEEAGFDDFFWFDTLDTQAGIFVNDHRCVLAFRGTEPDEIGDWLADVNVFQREGQYGMVHGGFQEALDHVWDDILPVMNEYSGRIVYVTGHSLGAALATLAVSRLDYGSLYTFGSPRVFDKDGAKEFDKRHLSYRLVNNNDIVCRVPLRYRHVGELYYFAHDGEMWIKPRGAWMTWDRLYGRIWRRIDGIRDHSMDEYIRLLELTGRKYALGVG